MFTRLGKVLANKRQNRLVRRFHGIIKALHQAIENNNYDFDTNGESWTLNQISQSRQVKTVLDVGANKGIWTEIALRIFKDASIHSFEIVPDTYEYLIKRVGESDHVHPNNVGLSDEPGELTMFYDKDKLELATSVAGFTESFHQYKPTELKLPVTTGDSYCQEKGIDHIDFLKIDVEGAEAKVLRGFEQMLSQGKVDIIQFEYGYINIDVGFLLKDFYDYLGQFEMSIGKIYPNHVEFRPYRHMDEDFIGPNFVAVKSSRTDLIKALS